MAAATLSGCDAITLFDTYDIPERPEVAAAPWPRLINTPPAPPVGTYTAAVPDPAEGVATQADLGAAGVAADVRAAELAAPVVTGRPASRGAGQVADRGVTAPADSELAAAAAARAAALAGPVIPEAERAAMLEAARRSPPAVE